MPNKLKVKVLVAQSCLTLCDPLAVALQAPLSMGFSRQEYWNGLPFSPPGDIPHPGIEPGLHADFLSAGPSGKPMDRLNTSKSQTKL